MKLLKFGKGNAKLGKNVATFSLPAGFTCPGANECLSKANKTTGKITDGKETVFRCFAASGESLFPAVRKQRWHNFDLLRKYEKNGVSLTNLIIDSLPTKQTTVRIHVSGDFYNQQYFDAWMNVAACNPKKVFYFYTKNIPVWLARMVEVGNGYIPGLVPNFVPTASLGSKYDDLIREYNLRYARVVYTEKEAEELQLEIDHDDFHAMNHGESFALLIHGTQPKGSESGKAVSALNGKGSYSRKSLPLIGGN